MFQLLIVQSQEVHYDLLPVLDCYAFLEADSCAMTGNGSVYYNKTCYNASAAREHGIAALVKSMRKRPPAEEYFE